MANSEVRLPEIEEIMAKRGICDGGKVQEAVDLAIVKYNLDYCPWLSGELANSPYSHDIGIGQITYGVENNGFNYASYQYYLQTEPENYSNQNGLRGNAWNDRMKLDHIKDIISIAQNVLDGGTYNG